MRAIVVHEGGGPEVLKLEEVPDPTPAEGQVLVRVEAAAVNHFDLTQRMSPEMTGATPPFTPGLDAAGTRVDTGERVLVTGALGAYAELIAAPAENVRPIPDSLDAAHAAGLGVAYKTAWAGLADGGLEKGETLLVQAGSSGTGQAAIDIGLYREPRSMRPRAPRSTTACVSSAPSRWPTRTRKSPSSVPPWSSTPCSVSASS
jgi:NADPH2:quinone reductase